MFLYTALGDSITAGEGATSWEFAYPSLIVQGVQRSPRARQVSPIIGEVLAHPGWTSADLDNAVFENSSVYLRDARAISIWVGGDDLAYAGIAMLQGARSTVIANSIAKYAKNLLVLAQRIQSISRCPLVLCTQYNPFPNSPIAAEGIANLNAATQRVAALCHAQIAPTEAWFAGREKELIAGYRTGRLEDVLKSPILPIHPNNRGHRVIAAGLMPLLIA